MKALKMISELASKLDDNHYLRWVKQEEVAPVTKLVTLLGEGLVEG